MHLATPAANEDRRLFVDRLTAQPEPPTVDRIKGLVQRRYGILNLLDIGADRLVGLPTSTHSGTKEVRSRETLRPLLLLDLFAKGRIRALSGSPQRIPTIPMMNCSMSASTTSRWRPCAMPMAPVNKILALRNPQLWGMATPVPRMANGLRVGGRIS